MQFLRLSMTAEGAGTFMSLWKGSGTPGAGSNPPLFSAGSGYVPTDATPGSWTWANNLATSLYGLDAWGATAGQLILYDRVWACSGFNTTTTPGAQTIVTPGLPGRQNGNYAGLEAWGEVYTAPGATGANWTLAYTDDLGNASTSVYAHPANAETVGQMFPFPLAAGDRGVQSVQSLTCSASSGTAGDIGITLMRRIISIPILPNSGLALDMFGVRLPPIPDDACLALMVLCSTTSTGVIGGSISLTQA
jgi:hypothetical protein